MPPSCEKTAAITSIKASFFSNYNQRGALDHKMMLRASFGIILLTMVTGLMKGYALKKNASNSTPRLAYEYFKATGLGQVANRWSYSKEAKAPRDGWGNAFYFDANSRILFSAGLDERFQTADDLPFVFLSNDCDLEQRLWFKESLKKGASGISSLPDGMVWERTVFGIKRQGKDSICKLPDLSGADGRYGSDDDWAPFVRVLEEGEPPPYKPEKEKA